MITVRRAGGALHERSRDQQVWSTFDVQDRVRPAGRWVRGPRRVSTRSAWRRGAPSRAVLGPMPRSSPTSTAAGSPATGRWDARPIQAGEFQRTTPGGTGRQREKNASRTDWAHVFRLWLGPCQGGLEPALTQKRFSAADRRGALCVIASPDGREDRYSFTRTPSCTRRCSARANTSSTRCRKDEAPGYTSWTGRSPSGASCFPAAMAWASPPSARCR